LLKFLKEYRKAEQHEAYNDARPELKKPQPFLNQPSRFTAWRLFVSRSVTRTSDWLPIIPVYAGFGKRAT